MNKNKAAVIGMLMISLSSAAIGAGIMQLVLTKQTQVVWSNTYFYYSQTNNEKEFAIRNDGDVEFGSRYNRDVEARKLLEVAKGMLGNYIPLDCHETGYRAWAYESPDHGVMRPYDRRTAPLFVPLFIERKVSIEPGELR